MKKIRVLVADDRFIARQGLSGILQGEEDMECVAIAEDGEHTVIARGDKFPLGKTETRELSSLCCCSKIL